MIQKVLKEAEYVITHGSTIELYPAATTLEADVIARAQELEAADPTVTTTWHLQSKVIEEVFLPGSVVETVTDNDRLYSITGAVAERALRNGTEELELRFYLGDPQSGDIIDFLDAEGNLVAEITIE